MADTTIERLYTRAYKEATGNGEKHRAAHIQGLQAVMDHGKQFSVTHPLRNTLAKCIRNASRWIEG